MITELVSVVVVLVVAVIGARATAYLKRHSKNTSIQVVETWEKQDPLSGHLENMGIYFRVKAKGFTLSHLWRLEVSQEKDEEWSARIRQCNIVGWSWERVPLGVPPGHQKEKVLKTAQEEAMIYLRKSYKE